MSRLINVAVGLLIAGVACIFYARTFPLYTESNGPGRISAELESLPREQRFNEWHSRLRAIETPHKRWSDFGRGLLAGGVGLLASLWLWSLYHRSSRSRSFVILLLLWSGLWLVRIPFSFWYYLVRQERFDYPAWGDSTAIPVFSESAVWIAGAVITPLLLRVLLIGVPLPASIRFAKPSSAANWLRAVVVGIWLAFLALCIPFGVLGGDEGTVFTCMNAGVILLFFLSAIVNQSDKPNEGAAPTTDSTDVATSEAA